MIDAADKVLTHSYLENSGLQVVWHLGQIRPATNDDVNVCQITRTGILNETIPVAIGGNEPGEIVGARFVALDDRAPSGGSLVHENTKVRVCVRKLSQPSKSTVHHCSGQQGNQFRRLTVSMPHHNAGVVVNARAWIIHKILSSLIRHLFQNCIRHDTKRPATG